MMVVDSPPSAKQQQHDVASSSTFHGMDDDDDRDYENAARFLHEFHSSRHSLSLHVIAEEEEDVDDDVAACTALRENANTGSLSKMEASMCLSSLALSLAEDDDNNSNNTSSCTTRVQNSLTSYNDVNDEDSVLFFEDCSPTLSSSSWGQFISSDDSFVRMPSSSLSSSSTASPHAKSKSSSSSSPSSVRSGCYYLGTMNLSRHYRFPNSTKN